jgi:hypothetical protein
VVKVKKESPGSLPCGRLKLRRPKEEDVHLPPLEPKKWWEMELDAHADYRGPDDPADAQGQQLLFGQSLNENYCHVVYNVWEAELWSLCRPCRHRSFSTADTKRGGVMGLLR